MWQIRTLGQKRQCNFEGIRPDKNAFGKMMRSVLLHSDVLRGVMLQLISGELGVLFVLRPLSLYTSHFCFTLFSLANLSRTFKHKRTRAQAPAALISPIPLTQGHCSCLLSSHLISLSVSHTQNTHTRSHCHPLAFIYSLYFLIQFDEWVTAWHFIRQD